MARALWSYPGTISPALPFAVWGLTEEDPRAYLRILCDKAIEENATSPQNPPGIEFTWCFKQSKHRLAPYKVIASTEKVRVR